MVDGIQCGGEGVIITAIDIILATEVGIQMQLCYSQTCFCSVTHQKFLLIDEIFNRDYAFTASTEL